MVGQYSISMALVWARSMARSWASGESVMQRSNMAESSMSSKVLGWYLPISMPISSITSTAMGSSWPARTPAASI